MADASCMGEERFEDAALYPNPQRQFDPDAVVTICSLLSAWVAEGRLDPVTGIPTRSVTPNEMEQAGGSISPWSYLHSAAEQQSTC